MIKKTDKHRPAIEPILPLINIVFLLLIFFMVAGKLRALSIDNVTAPSQLVTTEAIESEPAEWFYLTAEGDLYYQDQQLTLVQLQEKLQVLEQQKTPVLMADGDTKGHVFTPVLSVFKKSQQGKVMIVTEFIEPSELSDV